MSAFVVIHLMASRGQARLRNLMRLLDSVNKLPLNNKLKLFSFVDGLKSF